MTLILNNDDVKSVLTMKMTMEALQDAYEQLVKGTAVTGPRYNVRIPTREPERTYAWGSMDGGSSESEYFAIRMKSDVLYEHSYSGVRTREKYCVQPGLFCGLVLLFNVRNGEPLALLNDGYLQHMRVGADGGVGAGYMARENASVVGMLGSGGMARSHAEAFCLARNIRKIQVYSPTKDHRETYAQEVSAKLGIEVVACDQARDVYRGADILASCTDSAEPVIVSDWLEEGTHITNIGGGLDDATLKRIDRSLRFGTAPAPVGHPELRFHDESLTYEARPPSDALLQDTEPGDRRASHGVIVEDRAVFLEDLLSGAQQGRRSTKEITYSERGNIQGAQFFSVASKVYEAARSRGIGHEIPTEWLLQDIRD